MLQVSISLTLNTLAVNKSHYKFHAVIGKGGFGRVSIHLFLKVKVWKVERKQFESEYAMKEMSKAKVVNKKSVQSILNERKLLTMLKHP